MKFILRLLALLAVCTIALSAFAAEPTIAQVYQAANDGQLDRANAMVDQVLQAHPQSAKAHYVKAELAARGRQWDLAHEELAKAEAIAPKLPFAKPESVQALRNQLAKATDAATNVPAAQRQQSAPAAVARTPISERFPWGTLAIVVAVVVMGVMALRRRTIAPAVDVGHGGGYGDAGPAGYAGPAPQQPSMGSTLARGLGTGLAVGAGVVAAEEIGRRMFGHGEANAAPLQHDYGNAPTLDQIDEGMRHNLNTDMGGNDFGITADGWDDGGGGDIGGGWDS